MEATKLATALTSAFAPALPYLLTASPIDQLDGEKISAEAIAAYKTVWQKIFIKTKEWPAVLETAQNVARDTKDPAAQAAFCEELRKLLASDSAFFNDIKRETIHHYAYHHFHTHPLAAAGASTPQRVSH